MTRPDPHAAALYAIEHRVLEPVSRRFRDVAEARAHVEDLVASDWFGSRWPDRAAPAVARRGSGARWSLALQPCGAGDGDDGGVDGTILLAGLELVAVLHELAHLCCGVDHGHGDTFVATLLVLVRHEMGVHSYGALLSAVVAERRWPFVHDELARLTGGPGRSRPGAGHPAFG